MNKGENKKVSSFLIELEIELWYSMILRKTGDLYEVVLGFDWNCKYF